MIYLWQRARAFGPPPFHVFPRISVFFSKNNGLAGLEHLSRRTTENADYLLIVCDQSRKAFQTAETIKEMVKGLEIKIKKLYLITNKYSEENREAVEKSAEETGIEVLGKIELDEEVQRIDSLGTPLLELPEESKAYVAASSMFKKLLG